MHHSVQNMKTRLQEVDGLYQTLIASKLQVESYVSTSTLTAEELVDVSYLMKRVSERLDDARKEFERVRETVAQVVGAEWTVKAMSAQNPSKYPKSIHGLVAVGTPDCKTIADPPKADTEQYAELHGWLMEHAPDVLHVHWPKYCELITRLKCDSQPLPPHTLNERTRHTLALRANSKGEA